MKLGGVGRHYEKTLPGDQGLPMCARCLQSYRYSIDMLGRTVESCRCNSHLLAVRGNRFEELPPLDLRKQPRRDPRGHFVPKVQDDRHPWKTKRNIAPRNSRAS